MNIVEVFTGFEFKILYLIQGIYNNILSGLMAFFSTIGNVGTIWLITAVILIVFKKSRKCGLVMLCSIFFVYVSGELILKNLIQRIRPCNYPDLVLGVDFKSALKELPTSFSFPSGHSGSSFAAATGIFLYYKRAGIFAFIIASLIAFSRLYNFVHFPTDVLAGVIIGVLSTILIFNLFKKYENKKQESKKTIKD